MILHAALTVQQSPAAIIVVQSPDTDVLILCIAHFTNIACEESWFRKGVRDLQRYIPVHTIQRSLGDRICQSLPAFHALTGCDSTSSIAGIGKKKAWKVLKQSTAHQKTLGLFGWQQYLNAMTVTSTEAFICHLYPVTRRSTSTTDELRYLMFCQRNTNNEMLPPTSDCLKLHLNRSCHVVYS